jgi:choline dehydrogenase-like flavoprotein
VQANGSVTEIEARTVILACGAIENARLLLLSGFRSAWLGKAFMEHARDFSLVLMPTNDLFTNASFYDQHTTEDGTWIGGRIAPTPEAIEEFDIPHASMTLVPRAREDRGLLSRAAHRITRAAGRAWRGRYGWSSVRAPERAFDAFKIVLNFEHDPRASNRVELGDRRDRYGNRLPILYLEWTDREQARLERLRRLIKEWFRQAGVGELLIKPGARPDLSAHHHAGTTRMGSTPEDGVVDPWGRLYGVDNLYAAGASVFRTVGFANPTLTIVAMSLRLAQHVDGELG